MIRKTLTHIKNGTFLKVFKEKIKYELGIKDPVEVSRWGANSEEKAIEFLAVRAGEIALKKNKNVIVLIIPPEKDTTAYQERFKNLNRQILTVELEKMEEILKIPTEEIACIVCFCFDARGTMKAGQFLMHHESTREIPFEYILLPQVDFERVKKVDLHRDDSFTSPLFEGSIDYLKIYEESLTRFEQKCDIRDYMDLCQALGHIVKNNVQGAVAEFGSFRGHSGYLITQTLKALGAEKNIMLFDMFAEFPSESLGVDYFWDKHEVNYEEVKSKFKEFKNVQLVKGDFTETILSYPDLKLSFIFIDCDSYRATKFLVNHLFDKHLNPGGILVFEDYGHPALLGNRLAVHECFDQRKDCFTFYSQFSGFYIVAKNFKSALA